jgi:hypothetical protein
LTSYSLCAIIDIVRIKLSISVRTVIGLALVLGVFFIPLAHSAHFHEGDGRGDASLHATCVVCSAAHSYYAECVAPVGLVASTIHNSDLTPETSVTFHSILLHSEASRAPPLSLN